MEEDIQNYSPTVMFRGTPCISRTHLHLCLALKVIEQILIHVCVRAGKPLDQCESRSTSHVCLIELKRSS